MKIDLTGKNAIVCGASQGIGKAIAFQLAECGANVAILARNNDKLQDVMSSMKNNGEQQHASFACDLDDLDTAIEIIDSWTAYNGGYHVLINNTGGPKAGKISEAEAEELETTFRRHVISAQKITQLVLPFMQDERYGRIINIISVGLKQPIANLGVSNTIRGAMGSWAKTLSAEVAKYGVTVNNILPGFTKTDRLLELIETRSKLEKNSYADIEIGMLTDIPAFRTGKPEEIGYLAAFLASEYAAYITGTSIPVDGGYLKCI